MMRPALTFVVVTSAIGGLQLFDLVFMLFPNASYGPGGAGMTMIAHIYDQGFSSQFRLGYAAAVGWVVFFIIFIFSLIQLKAFGFGSNDE
jgi:ABC-type sugar transport system permease subunit